MLSDPRLCACGSGLRAVRCCRLDPAMLPPGEAARPLVPVVERAVELHRQGNAAEAEKLCLEVLELAPGQPEALSLLYRIRRDGGAECAAEALLRRIVALDPNTFWATNELALLLLGKGTIAEAEIHARNAVRIAPENPQSHNLMGMIMTEANRPQVGEHHYRQVIALSRRRDPILLANLAWNLKNQGRMAEARGLYEESSAVGPEILQTLLGWARMEEADRNFERAAELLDRAEKLAPDNPSILLSRAVVLGRIQSYEKALALLDEIAGQNRDGGLGANELLEKGRLLDKMGRYAEAFAAFDEGKRLCREVSGLVYLDEQARQVIDRSRGFFTQTRLRIMPRAELRTDLPQPIFILGFPRSGTTLVEQTLSAHPQIAAGDELPFVNEITGSMPRMLNSPLAYPEALAELWMGDRANGLDELRDYYLQRVRQLGILRARRPVVHRQDAAQRDPSGADRADVSPGADDPRVAASARRRAVGLLQPFDPRLLLRLCARDRGAPLRAGHGAGRALPRRDDAALPAGPLRGHRRRAGSERAAHARLHRRAVRSVLPAVPRKPPLCAHRQLCPGDRAALRPLALSLSALPERAGAGDPDPRAG